jgi:hypothetical protein
MALITGSPSASGMVGMPQLVQPASGEPGAHGQATDLAVTVQTPHFAQARPHIEPLAVESIFVVGVVVLVAGSAYLIRRVTYFIEPQPP